MLKGGGWDVMDEKDGMVNMVVLLVIAVDSGCCPIIFLGQI